MSSTSPYPADANATEKPYWSSFGGEIQFYVSVGAIFLALMIISGSIIVCLHKCLTCKRQDRKQSEKDKKNYLRAGNRSQSRFQRETIYDKISPTENDPTEEVQYCQGKRDEHQYLSMNHVRESNSTTQEYIEMNIQDNSPKNEKPPVPPRTSKTTSPGIQRSHFKRSSVLAMETFANIKRAGQKLSSNLLTAANKREHVSDAVRKLDERKENTDTIARVQPLQKPSSVGELDVDISKTKENAINLEENEYYHDMKPFQTTRGYTEQPKLAEPINIAQSDGNANQMREATNVSNDVSYLNKRGYNMQQVNERNAAPDYKECYYQAPVIVPGNNTGGVYQQTATGPWQTMQSREAVPNFDPLRQNLIFSPPATQNSSSPPSWPQQYNTVPKSTPLPPSFSVPYYNQTVEANYQAQPTWQNKPQANTPYKEVQCNFGNKPVGFHYVDETFSHKQNMFNCECSKPYASHTPPSPEIYSRNQRVDGHIYHQTTGMHFSPPSNAVTYVDSSLPTGPGFTKSSSAYHHNDPVHAEYRGRPAFAKYEHERDTYAVSHCNMDKALVNSSPGNMEANIKAGTYSTSYGVDEQDPEGTAQISITSGENIDKEDAIAVLKDTQIENITVLPRREGDTKACRESRFEVVLTLHRQKGKRPALPTDIEEFQC